MNNGLFLHNYHIGEETPDERSFFMDLVAKLNAKYPLLKLKCDAIFNKEGHDYSKHEREQIIYRISKSIYRNLLVASDIGEVDINHALKVIKNQLIECLPYYMVNDETFNANRGHITEPVVIYDYYILSSIMKEITAMERRGFDSREDALQIYMFNNVLRGLKSSIVLFAIGDDVHGMATMRGVIELSCRLDSLTDQNIGDALQFSYLNNLLQNHKMGNVKDTDMDPELQSFLKQHNLTKGAAEMFLLNGWIKNKKGKPIVTNSELIDHVYGKNSKDLKDYYHLCSEFVHEDYTLAGYSFVSLRETFKLFISAYVNTFKDECGKRSIKLDGQTRSCFNSLNNLVKSLMNEGNRYTNTVQKEKAKQLN